MIWDLDTMNNGKKRGQSALPSSCVRALGGLLDAEAARSLANRRARPFEDDREFWKDAGVAFLAHSRYRRLVRDQDRDPQGRQRVVVERRIRALAQIEPRLAAAFENRIRLAMADPHPLFLRFAKRLQLSRNEVNILVYVVLYSTHAEFRESLPISFSSPAMQGVSEFLDLSVYDLFEIFGADGPLVQSKLFESQASYRGGGKGLLQRELDLSEPVLKGLLGILLTTEDFLKIDGTPLAEVVERPVTLDKELRRPAEDAPPAEEPSPFDDVEADSPEAALQSVLQDPAGEASPAPAIEDEGDLAPYQSDVEYLSDRFAWLTNYIEASKHLDDDSVVLRSEDDREMVRRSKQAMERMLRNRCARRLDLTRRAGRWQPRLERLGKRCRLDDFEKSAIIALLAEAISPQFSKTMRLRSGLGNVGDLILLFAPTFEEQVRCRKYFYKSSPLLKYDIVKVSDNSYRTLADLLKSGVALDRRMLEYLVGLETEFSELIEGSHLYSPKVRLENVILPEAQKRLIVETVSSFPRFRDLRRRLKLEDLLPTGHSVMMLFYGPSGTGKTMMANAIANHLHRKVLLINYPSLGEMAADTVLQMVFREARINDAILFFDECEAIFRTRDQSNPGLSLLLTEIERYDGIMILATNRPVELDEAMHRRITLAVEFTVPDSTLRHEIWDNHLPKGIERAPDVDLRQLATRFELTGGFIKNAVVTALSKVSGRDGAPLLTMHDLEEGAKLQLRGRLSLMGIEQRIVPQQGLENLVVPDEVMGRLRDVVNLERSRGVLFTQWGFRKSRLYGMGTTALFSGPSGTGKTMAAECVAFELGRPLHRVNLAHLVSKWVGETGKNIEAVFAKAAQEDTVLVLDEAEALLAERTSVESSTDRYANLDVNLLLQAMERHPGMVVLVSNHPDLIDPAMLRRLRFVIEFPTPDAGLREVLWRRLLPEEVPRDGEIDFGALARQFELTGAHIRNAIFRAAGRVVGRDSEHRRLTHADLALAAQEEASAKPQRRIGFVT